MAEQRIVTIVNSDKMSRDTVLNRVNMRKGKENRKMTRSKVAVHVDMNNG